jgi:3',5'-cyclic-AMP phosphodiesterase
MTNQAGGEENMRLVLMGDLHYHNVDGSIPGWRDARDRFYGSLLGKFLDIEADWHISLGDLTNFGTPAELEGVFGLIRRRDRRFVHVLGNHDLYAMPRDFVLRANGGQRYHAVETGEAVLAFLDTAREQDRRDWSGHVDEAQLAWLESVVRASGTRPLLVFAHHPVYNTTARSTEPKGSIVPEIDIRAILGMKRGVGVYFNGHTHAESIVREDNWTFVQLAACLDVPSFRLVTVEADEIRIDAVDLDDDSLIADARFLHRYMPHFAPREDARGGEADRTARVGIAPAPSL